MTVELRLRTCTDRFFGALQVGLGLMLVALAGSFIPDARTSMAGDLLLGAAAVFALRLLVSGLWMSHPRGVVRMDAASLVIDRPAVFRRPVVIPVAGITMIELERTGHGPTAADGFAGVMPISECVEVHLRPPLRLTESRDTLALGTHPVPPRRRRPVTSVLCPFTDNAAAVAELRRWHRAAVGRPPDLPATTRPRLAMIADHPWLLCLVLVEVAVLWWHATR